jgi:hypothetical protein
MRNREDNDCCCSDSLDQPIAVRKTLANRHVTELWHNPATLRERTQRLCSGDEPCDDRPCLPRGVTLDVLGDLFNVLYGLGRPSQFVSHRPNRFLASS